MSRRCLVLRPEPGAAATVARLEAAGLAAMAMPLFATRAIAWAPPDPADFDALLITSANAIRFAGAGLARLAHLPVVAVGAASAAAAQAAGLVICHTGTGDAASAVAGAAPMRLLHLAGRDRVAVPGVTAVTVYAAEALPPPAGLATAAQGAVALLHSARAARRLAALIEMPATTRIAAISAAVAAAAGRGWEAVAVAARPDDAALVAAATTLAIDP